MPRRYEMGTLVTRCQQRCDLVNDDHLATAEWKQLISEVYGELWSEVSSTGRRFFETSTTITADGSESYDEPEGHLSTLRIARVDSDGRESQLDDVMPDEEAMLKGQTGDARYWTLVDDQLFLYPVPSSGSYKWYYLQQPTELSSYADDDIVDVVCPAGEAFLIAGVAVLALGKREKNVQLWLTERERQRELLQVWAFERNKGDLPRRVDDDVPYDLLGPGEL